MFHYVYITIFILKADHHDANFFFPVKTNDPPIVEPRFSNFYYEEKNGKNIRFGDDD